MTQSHSKADSLANQARRSGASSYIGLSLLDSAGKAQAHNAGFNGILQAIEASVGEHARDEWEVIFPPGCRPPELIARQNPEEPVKTVLFSGDGFGIPVEIRLESVGRNWLLFVSATEMHLPDALETGHLEEQQATRAVISSYLHDTVCQNLVALSMLLAKVERDLETASSPALQRAGQVSERCARQIRSLMKVLSPPSLFVDDFANNSPVQSERATLDSVRDYLDGLRDEVGLNVSLCVTSEREPELTPATLTVLTAAVQKWAEGTLGGRASRDASTTVGVSSEGNGITVEFASDLVDDPAIAGLTASHSLRGCVLDSGGEMELVRSGTGSCARFWLRSKHQPALADRPARQEI